jgi:hypothetical protein
MPGKRIQFHDETLSQLNTLASDSMKSFQELADEAFRDLLKKHGVPATLKEALRRSVNEGKAKAKATRKQATKKGR